MLVADLDDPRDGASARWPGFSPAAYEAGARAVFAYPLALGAAKLGVLLLYGDRAGGLDADARATALRLADGAFFALLDLLSGSTSAVARMLRTRATSSGTRLPGVERQSPMVTATMPPT